jgi:hypothetical protein
MDSNVQEEVVFNQPQTLAERNSAAAKCCSAMKLALPMVVDTLDDHVDDLYAGWPERMYVIDATGKIAYAGKQGPWGFKVDEVDAALRRITR